MNKKDLDLQKKLGYYLEEERPSIELLKPAAELLRAKNAEKVFEAKRKAGSKRGWLYLGTVAAGILLLIIALVNSLPVKKGQESAGDKYYGFPQLSAAVIDKNDVMQSYPQLFSGFYAMENVSYMAYSFGDGTIAVIKLKTRIQTPSGIDDVIIYAELTEAVLTDFAFYHSLEEYPYGGASKAQTQNIDGEYITKAYIESGGVKYYIDLMSPTTDLPDGYFDLITGAK